MSEIIVLVFKDGTRYDLDTGNMKSLMNVLKVQKSKGDPVEIIGSGKGVERLRKQYTALAAGQYRPDVVGDVSEILGISVDAVKSKLNSIKKRLGVKS